MNGQRLREQREDQKETARETQQRDRQNWGVLKRETEKQ
jgi:hypothetical protein